jgi:hypothetical protein
VLQPGLLRTSHDLDEVFYLAAQSGFVTLWLIVNLLIGLFGDSRS